ncbi:glycosyltransferase family 2 protein [Cellulophaga sp. E16_2]|uniref:Glycosyl transferase family 2 n=1 Tax=Cellulophaga algicola (strain DSM 14237 / IC166 / ACAM 630) TaxID=688270 RepID=E6X9B8_CELAD|nr:MULTISPECIES: glycosyltransferase family 2 protein [Cellulophaga]ADV47657.1 glycosyl transferase family 2 [Cellulophaga algicola DSM 14237]MBO0590018.1 glycosyltransferase family 2 protein [Cellulophaga sp. E16_2]
MKNKIKITSLLITYNEEKFIKKFIESMSFADELIIIDSFSSDQTVAIIKEYPNVKLYQRVFDDFSSQKNYAIEKASNDWIIFFDADEEITPLLKEEIMNTIELAPNEVAFWVYRTTYYMGKLIKHSGLQNDKVIRLFKKEECRYNGNLVHEEIKANGTVGKLKNKINHYSYKGIDDIFRKRNKYANLQAIKLFEKGKKPNLFHFIIKPAFRFFSHYILKKGFLDGFQGFMIAYVYGYTVFMRYVKLWLLRNNLN